VAASNRSAEGEEQIMSKLGQVVEAVEYATGSFSIKVKRARSDEKFGAS
jgi:hypothetical protein